MMDIEMNELLLNLWAAFPYIFKLIRQGWPNEKNNELSIYHFEIIGILMMREGLSMSEIGQLLGIQKSNITPLVDKLVKDGLVSRFNDQNDRRIVRIILTDRGRAFMQDGKEKAKLNLAARLANMSSGDLYRLSEAFKDIHSLLTVTNKEDLVR